MSDETKTESRETLAESFSQSRRELWFMLGAWVFFFAWVSVACAVMGKTQPGEPVPTTFGMPSWVVFGVGIPWLAATATAIVFGLKIMKDTDLEGR